MLQFFKNTLKAFTKSTVRRKLIDITDKDAIAAARIAGITSEIKAYEDYPRHVNILNEFIKKSIYGLRRRII